LGFVHKASFAFNIVGLMGEKGDTLVPLPAPGMVATVKVIDQGWSCQSSVAGGDILPEANLKSQ